ncbi:hypothetical protein DFAR_2360007 [Desulfarculales bacterium]
MGWCCAPGAPGSSDKPRLPREFGFGLIARIIPRRDLPLPQPDRFEPAVLVLGLTTHETLALGGEPAA